MIVGILKVELSIPESGSLKDKRRVIRSLKDHLYRDLKLAVGEVGHQDHLTASTMGVAVVAIDGRRAAQTLDHADEMFRRHIGAEVVSTRRWIVRAKDLFDPSATPSSSDHPSSDQPEIDGLSRELADEMLEHFSADQPAADTSESQP